MNAGNIQDAYIQMLRESRRLQQMHRRHDEIFGREFTFLRMIWEFQMDHPDVQGIYVSDLAACMSVTKSGASKMLRNLEQRGLIERVVDKNNRRNTFVSLSPKGRAFCEEQRKHGDEMLRRVTDQLGEEHFLEIIAGIREMVQVMTREMSAMGNAQTNSIAGEETQCDLF